jgi:outer membrane protein assembly factor BamA
MPDHYWGVGYEAGKAPEGDSTTAYHRTSLNLLPKALWRLSPAIMVGPAIDINYTNATEVSPGMAADPYYLEYGPENQNNGIGGVFQYDTRDVAANAYKGLYLNAQVLSYGSLLGGDNDYVIYDVDYRQYHPLGRKGKTLAWTARGRWGTGSVPWAELSQLGGGSDVRGYRQGRYRDKIMAYWIVEYRHQFTNDKRESGLSRHGYVLFSSVGTVANETTDFGKLQVLPGWGAGYRFEVQPRMNVRVDLAFGREFLESGNKFIPSVYFNFTEAF